MFSSLGNLEFSVGTDGKGQYRVSGDSTWIPFLNGASGTLVVKFTSNLNTNKTTDLVDNNSGTVTIKITDGKVTSSNITGSGFAQTVGGVSNASSCSVSNYRITSVKWTPDN